MQPQTPAFWQRCPKPLAIVSFPVTVVKCHDKSTFREKQLAFVMLRGFLGGSWRVPGLQFKGIDPYGGEIKRAEA